MNIDKSIFLSCPDDVSVQGARNLGIEMQNAAIGSDGITILSAYFGTDYLINLFGRIPKKNRRQYQIRLVFGFERPCNLPSAIGSLRQFRENLIEKGFRRIEVKTINTGVPFHTKLYLLIKNYQKTWFVGSANASPAIRGARHEMMLRLKGPHEALSDYVHEIIKRATPIENELTAVEATDIRTFLLLGELCYQPQSRMSFSFEACQITSEDRAVLKKSLADISSVPHADPQTEGFGFSLTNAVGQLTGRSFAELNEATSSSDRGTARLKFRHLAVETIYGYWLPAPYAAEVRAKLQSNEAQREKALKSFRADLEGVSPMGLEAELEQHIEGLRAFFKAHSREVAPKPGYAGRFREFVKARQLWLADEGRVARSVRRLSLERMPDIWNDENAAEKFESSFFEDLAARYDDPRRSKVVRVMREELDVKGFPSPEALRAALMARLDGGFLDSLWSGEADDEDEEV